MRKLSILIISIFLLLIGGCTTYDGCLSKPELLAEGEVKQVKFITEGGAFGGINTVITFTDDKNIVIEGAPTITLYKKIRIYKTCVMGGSFIIEEVK